MIMIVVVVIVTMVVVAAMVVGDGVGKEFVVVYGSKIRSILLE